MRTRSRTKARAALRQRQRAKMRKRIRGSFVALNLRLVSGAARRAGVEEHVCELHLGLAAFAVLRVRQRCYGPREATRARQW